MIAECANSPRQKIGCASPEESRSCMDSRADAPILGDNVLMTHSCDRSVAVSSFDPHAPLRALLAVSGAIAFKMLEYGEAIILIVNQALHAK